MLQGVPVIDVAPFRQGDASARRGVAAAVGRAVHDIGLLVVTGHGVEPALVRSVQEASNAFFDLPSEEKLRVARPAPDVARGYIALEAESVGRSQGLDVPGDLDESLMIGPVDTDSGPYFTGPAAGKHFHPNLWPERPAELRPLYEAYLHPALLGAAMSPARAPLPQRQPRPAGHPRAAGGGRRAAAPSAARNRVAPAPTAGERLLAP